MIRLKYITNKKNYIEIKNQCNDNQYQRGGKFGEKKEIKHNVAKNSQISEKDLIILIEENTKPSMRARTEDDGSLENNIANYGMVPGDMAVRDGAEYNGLTIRATEIIKPILTDLRVIRAIKHLINSDIQNAIGVLRLNDEVIEHGIGIIYETLTRWLSNNDIQVPIEYVTKATNVNSKKINDWIDAFNWGPVNGKFEIAEIGHNKTSSVVPESWIGREFKNANELHAEMDKLEWRKNKPPVSFCVINSISLVSASKILSIRELKNTKVNNVKIGMNIRVSNDQIFSEIKIFDNKSLSKEWIQKIDESAQFSALIQDFDDSRNMIIVFEHNKLFEKSPQYIKKRSVGLLVSMLQKLLRRGPECSRGLEEIMTELWRSPGYNLPEQQFLRVSASRQLSWRLFITCLEDIQAYETNDKKLLAMQDLAILSIITNILTDLQFNEFVFKKILATGLTMQQISKKWELMIHDPLLSNELPLKDQNNQILNSFITLSEYMPSREWDNLLISSSYNYIKKKLFVPQKLIAQYDHNKFNKNTNNDAIISGMDMHPYPNILIVFQGSLPFIPHDIELHTTKKLWNFIWNKSSGVNYRSQRIEMNNVDIIMHKILRDIQKHLLYPDTKIIKTSEYDVLVPEKNKESTSTSVSNMSQTIDQSAARLGFILLFGQKKSFKYKNKKYDIVMAGYDKTESDLTLRTEICKIKYTVDDESKYLEDNEIKDQIIKEFFKSYDDQIDYVDPPIGYEWYGLKKGAKIKIGAKIENEIVKYYVNDTEIELCDASKVMRKIEMKKSIKCPESIKKIIKSALYIDKSNESDGYEINLLMRTLHEKNLPQYEWTDIAKKSELPVSFWVSVFVKLYNNYENEILIGPVDGQGYALRDSINYLYEGTIWRIFNMFSMLYSDTIIVTNAVKSLKFKINTNTPGYLSLTKSMNEMMRMKNNGKNEKDKDKIKIVTKLWDHQQKTVDKIMREIEENGRNGFGDASNVGSGKSLSCLSVMARLFEKMEKEKVESHEGFLVLLPTQALYKTWEDEIEKHCKGFHVVLQHANGELTDKLKKNSILITTLGRMRDHPLSQPWIFVVIDECLSVQNKNALQTEQAWCQISVSLYGALLCSATFFRARFDKLFYMLKMLKTGLPENKQYLDAILAESIVMNLPLKIREWETNYNPMKLSKKMRKEYDELLGLDLNSEKMYAKLLHYLHDNFNYVGAFTDVVQKCEKKGKRCLIYAKSKDQADLFAEKIKDVTRFPDVSGKHLVISFAEGTYGLNHLIYLNCIVTPIPDPDKLPQMKGRLDRPGQDSDILTIEYVYVDKTIDQGALFKMEMMNTFYKDYLIPLADFYDIAIGRKNKQDIIGKR